MSLRIIPYLLIIGALLGSLPVYGTELSIPPLRVKPGESLTIPIRIDTVDNLAGIRLVITYDQKFLIYKKAEKTTHTASLMHIVNDKKPGALILVMAGPKGIQAKDFSIIDLTFDIKSGLDALQYS